MVALADGVIVKRMEIVNSPSFFISMGESNLCLVHVRVSVVSGNAGDEYVVDGIGVKEISSDDTLEHSFILMKEQAYEDALTHLPKHMTAVSEDVKETTAVTDKAVVETSPDESDNTCSSERHVIFLKDGKFDLQKDFYCCPVRLQCSDGSFDKKVVFLRIYNDALQRNGKSRAYIKKLLETPAENLKPVYATCVSDEQGNLQLVSIDKAVVCKR